MKTYIANFGPRNWAWPECLRRHAIATMNDMRTHPLWESGAREAFIAEAMRVLKTRKGIPPDRNLAARWYNLADILVKTEGDIWVHRQKGQLWWTISKADPIVMEEGDDPDYEPGKVRLMIYYKPCLPWKNMDQKGRSLPWAGIHPKAREFLFTEGTFQSLSPDNSLYARALIDGKDLSGWHNRPEWRAKGEKSGKGAVRIFTPEEIAAANVDERMQQTAARMVKTAKQTTLQSGEEIISTTKDKRFQFANENEAREYALKLMRKQEGLCALTGLKMLLDDDPGDDQLRYSLDRIDSSGHYECGNLQVVCKFINKWKGAMDNEEFKRLIAKIRGQAE